MKVPIMMAACFRRHAWDVGVCMHAECIWLGVVQATVQGSEKVGVKVLSQLAYSNVSQAERSLQGPSSLGENSYFAPIQHRQLKNEWASDRAWEGRCSNERPTPGMYTQVYLVKLSDLFF